MPILHYFSSWNVLKNFWYRGGGDIVYNVSERIKKFVLSIVVVVRIVTDKGGELWYCQVVAHLVYDLNTLKEMIL